MDDHLLTDADADIDVIDDLERDVESFRVRADCYDHRHQLARLLGEMESDTYYAFKRAIGQTYDDRMDGYRQDAQALALAEAARQVQDAEDVEEQWRLEHERFMACAPVCPHCQSAIERMGQATVDDAGRLVHRPGACPRDPSRLLTVSSLPTLAA